MRYSLNSLLLFASAIAICLGIASIAGVGWLSTPLFALSLAFLQRKNLVTCSWGKLTATAGHLAVGVFVYSTLTPLLFGVVELTEIGRAVVLVVPVSFTYSFLLSMFACVLVHHLERDSEKTLGRGPW